MSSRKANVKIMGSELQTALEQLRKSETYDKEAVRDEISEQIHLIMAREEVKPAELARRLGKSRAYVTKILQGNANFTIDSLVQIARALGYRYAPVFVAKSHWKPANEFHVSARAEARATAPATLDNSEYEPDVPVTLRVDEGGDEEDTTRVVG
jgi:transcriptional regulator with XRE-family HTH domain